MMIKGKLWSQIELKYLIQNFPIYGSNHCSEYLKRSSQCIQTKAQKLGIVYIGNEKENKYSYDNMSKIVSESLNFSDVVRKLGLHTGRGNRKTVKNYIELYKLDISHFIFFKKGNKIGNEIPLEEILIQNSSYSTTHLKNKLYKHDLKKRICELCGQGENWNGMKISLILDHKNGINNDNRIDNLQIVCPNCNAGLETFCSKSIKYKSEINYTKTKSNLTNNVAILIQKQKIKYFCECGIEIEYKSKKCWPCNVKKRNERVKPSYEQLKQDIEELGYSATGRKYEVSDNCIRKWINKYIMQ